MTSLPSALMYKIIDFYTSDSKRDWAAEYYGYMERSKTREKEREEKLKAERVPNTKPTHDLKGFVGAYEDAMYGKATVSMKDGKLHLVMEPTATLFHATLTHWHYNTFRFRFADPFLPAGLITFTVDKEGKIEGFTIDLPNPDFHFYNLNFKKLAAK
jgi:hypothetical protein